MDQRSSFNKYGKNYKNLRRIYNQLKMYKKEIKSFGLNNYITLTSISKKFSIEYKKYVKRILKLTRQPVIQDNLLLQFTQSENITQLSVSIYLTYSIS